MRGTSGDVAERNGKYTPLLLAEARERTPAVTAAEALRQSLAMALFGEIGEDDIRAIAGQLKKKALDGDVRAQKTLLDLVTRSAGGSGAGRPPAAERTVMIESVAAGQLRRLAAMACLTNGAMSVAALARLVGLTESDTSALLDSDWFKSGPDGVELTPAGRRAVG